MTNEARKIARTRLLKRIGIIGLITSSAIGLVFLILSLLPHGKAAFTIRIDDPTSTENSNFKIFTNSEDATSSSNSVTYLAAEPMPNTTLTEARFVEEYLTNLRAEKELKGNDNFKSEAGKDLAMVYTIYLTNTTEEDISIKYAVNLDAYKLSNEDAVSPIEYFRVLVQTETVGEADSLSNVYYGQKRSGRFDYKYIFDNEEGRETISTPETYPAMDGWHVTKDSTWNSPGNDGYCINFNDYTFTDQIVVSDVKVPVGKVLRYTFVAYFEGEDLDSSIRAQSDNYMLLSLHFGV